METKNYTQVLIDGKIYTLGGSEDEAYLQRTASYVNDKIAGLHGIPGFSKQSADYQQAMIQLNIADDYFKAANRSEQMEEARNQMEKESYSLKHELVSTQMKLEAVLKDLEDRQLQLEEMTSRIARMDREIKGLKRQNEKLAEEQADAVAEVEAIRAAQLERAAQAAREEAAAAERREAQMRGEETAQPAAIQAEFAEETGPSAVTLEQPGEETEPSAMMPEQPVEETAQSDIIQEESAMSPAQPAPNLHQPASDFREDELQEPEDGAVSSAEAAQREDELKAEAKAEAHEEVYAQTENRLQPGGQSQTSYYQPKPMSDEELARRALQAARKAGFHRGRR